MLVGLGPGRCEVAGLGVPLLPQPFSPAHQSTDVMEGLPRVHTAPEWTAKRYCIRAVLFTSFTFQMINFILNFSESWPSPAEPSRHGPPNLSSFFFSKMLVKTYM